MTSIRQALRARYAAPQYAYFEEVANGTGARIRRYADGVAMSLWPSRGLTLTCFEIKEARSDFLREIKNPEKAEEIGKRCDYFFIVAPPEVVKDLSELPPAWGYLQFKSGKLVQKKAAERTASIELDRNFLAALLRRLHEGFEREKRELVHKESIADELKKAEERGRAVAEIEFKGDIRELKQLKECVDIFEENAGIKIVRWGPGNVDLGKAVKKVLSVPRGEGILNRIRADQERLADYCERTAAEIRKKLEEE